MKKWENKVLTTTIPPDEKLLEQFSRDGYELVTTVFFAMTGNWYTYFKRQVVDEVNPLLDDDRNLSGTDGQMAAGRSAADSAITGDIPF